MRANAILDSYRILRTEVKQLREEPLRQKFPVYLTCRFCCRDSAVSCESQHAWDCQRCNGFNKEEDSPNYKHQVEQDHEMTFIQEKTNTFICLKVITVLAIIFLIQSDIAQCFTEEADSLMIKFYSVIGCTSDLLLKTVLMKQNYRLGYVDGVSFGFWLLACGEWSENIIMFNIVHLVFLYWSIFDKHQRQPVEQKFAGLFDSRFVSPEISPKISLEKTPQRPLTHVSPASSSPLKSCPKVALFTPTHLAKIKLNDDISSIIKSMKALSL
ncbi:unnamed protein product [Mytilus coruscus]|uniref:Uncharacterized protein n=1 Tax=Mytilus coruscus TaxID=42192 RepID=A0A6J8F3F9_MYTCO|nr:unnamed protein product [Mytilus coruscus]